MPWVTGPNTLKLSRYIILLIRVDKYFDKLQEEMHLCSLDHINCLLCDNLPECRNWYDSWMTKIYNKNNYLSEEYYNAMIKEFRMIKGQLKLCIPQ